MSNWLDDDYEKPASGGNYTKWQPGPNKIRILSRPIWGTLGWQETDGKKKPVRTPKKDDPPAGLADVKHFWAFTVWNYAKECIEVCEVTQSSIQDAILRLKDDPDWGDPLTFNLTVHKEGQGMETKYTVTPSPGATPENAVAALGASPVNLKALFTGEDPFSDEIPF